MILLPLENAAYLLATAITGVTVFATREKHNNQTEEYGNLFVHSFISEGRCYMLFAQQVTPV